MSEQTANTECRICGKMYYSCKTCKDINHWKAVACCPEHYAEYVEQIYRSRINNEVVVEATNEEITIVKPVSKKSLHTKISEKNK